MGVGTAINFPKTTPIKTNDSFLTLSHFYFSLGKVKPRQLGKKSFLKSKVKGFYVVKQNGSHF